MGRKIKTGFRAAPKVQEKELIHKAEALRSRPEVLVPECIPDSCPRCPFDSLLLRLRRIAQVSQDEGRLERLARRGPPLARAYAATLLVAAQGKAPYLAPAKTPYGTFHYALRGKARRDELVGVQYYDVPELRLLTVGQFAKRKGIHVYSLESKMVTTCREDNPPLKFVDETIQRAHAGLHREDKEVMCPHPAEGALLVIDWIGAGIRITLCKRCGPSKGNFVTLAGERMVVTSLANVFNIAIRLNVPCVADACSMSGDHPLEEGVSEKYLTGKKTESEVLEAEVPKLIERLARENGLLVVQGECFEDDHKAFLRRLKLQEELSSALQEVLQDLTNGLVIPDATPAKLIEALSRAQRRSLLSALLKDEDMAEALMKAGESEGRGADEILEEALGTRRDMAALSKLPSWERLPPGASLVDSVARCYKSKGRAEASLLASKGLQGEVSQRVLAFALLKALDSAAGKEWMFKPEEKQLADHLAPKATRLLDSEGKAYGDLLQELLTASGSGEVIPK